MKVIINADDFGINAKVTKSIIECIDDGLISSTTIMANGDCLDQVKMYTIKHPEISYGIHYCLSEFKSITKSKTFEKYGLTNQDGVFIKKAIMSKKRINKELEMAIFDELCAQTEKLLSMEFEISHVDSHHHIHTLPQLQNIFIRVMKIYKLSRVRISQPYTLLSRIRHPFSWISYRQVLNKYQSEFRTVDYFSSYKNFILKPYICNEIELMCHPGHPFVQYSEEINLLKKNLLKEMIDYKLISYKDL